MYLGTKIINRLEHFTKIRSTLAVIRKSAETFVDSMVTNGELDEKQQEILSVAMLHDVSTAAKYYRTQSILQVSTKLANTWKIVLDRNLGSNKKISNNIGINNKIFDNNNNPVNNNCYDIENDIGGYENVSNISRNSTKSQPNLTNPFHSNPFGTNTITQSKFEDTHQKGFVKRPGDWYCGNCSNLNFSWRNKCNGCSHLNF